eukprot:TRINITY_DN743_c0_g1_i4.p1 TRINITY_DN743_c0_g1~~TRINITY_DN743_c0_g1_i4.p1  ORF type:complete len:383 (+),score=62.52 TRINITY_DN743_c0_g1_i4:490-1638(+)
MASHYRSKEASHALQRLRDMNALTSKDYECAIQAHTLLCTGALWLLYQMDKEGFQWTQRACSHALQACGKTGRLDDALKVLAEMRKRGLSPSDIDYLNLIRGRARKRVTSASDSRGGREQAMQVLQLMEAAGDAPNIWHYTAAMKACAEEGDWVNASNIFQHMQNKGIQPDLQSWNVLLDALGGAGLIPRMLTTYQHMRTSGEQPNIITMSCMLAHAGTAGERSVAEAIWMEMRHLQLQPDATSYGSLINCYAVAKDWMKAERVLTAMCQPGASVKPDAFTFTILMKAYIVEAYLEAAAVIIDRMCAAGVQPTIPTWTAIIQAADALGDPKRADELYSEALECGASKPHIPWHRKAFHDTSGRPMNLSEGTIVSANGPGNRA